MLLVLVLWISRESSLPYRHDSGSSSTLKPLKDDIVRHLRSHSHTQHEKLPYFIPLYYSQQKWYIFMCGWNTHTHTHVCIRFKVVGFVGHSFHFLNPFFHFERESEREDALWYIKVKRDLWYFCLTVGSGV